MSVETFQDRDDDYLIWAEAHRDGYVINVSRSERGPAMVHTVNCYTITIRPPFTGPYIKICSTVLAELEQWILDRPATVLARCGTCQPPGYIAGGQHVALADSASPASAFPAAEPHVMAADEWEIDGPDDDGERRVRLWSNNYIPFERLSGDQRGAREELKRTVRSLTAGADEVLHASYAGPKPAKMDVENLVLYNIDPTAGGCFRAGARQGVRFELATALHGDPPSGRPYACSYQYGLTSLDSSLSHWRLVRPLASFTTADLGVFRATRRLEKVWLAIRNTEPKTDGAPIAATERFAVFLRLSHPDTKPPGANPELVKALIDGTIAAFQAHGNRALAAEVAARLAVSTGQPMCLIEQTLLDDSHAVLGTDNKLVYLRGTGVQWNPADHLCVAGQVVCRQARGTTWTLSGEIHAIEQLRQAGSCS